ncbi:Acetylesterase [Colletotrichum trifolii]|uniref:Acetylesterase n=1 Tax=Colletotrichum trifolii TaxID=5466 RepID=A0A4R8RIV1_COLTR|nr:Acetylesterase [Colletotrichum trifolii]
MLYNIITTGQWLSLLSLAAHGVSAEYAGFSGLKTLFTFGDSYTRTGFVVSGAQPSASNPLGNPRYPGPTSANGQNWIQFLTTKYNDSLLLTHNFAYSGATVNKTLVESSIDVVTQIEKSFLPYYSGVNQTWDADTTLFGFWIGINDDTRSYLVANSTELHPQIFEDYRALVEKLYDAGARNFLFLNVPPLERMPRTTQSSAADERIPLQKAAVEDWNKRVRKLALNLKSAHSDAAVFGYNTYNLFNNVTDGPDRYPETELYKTTKTYCVAYQNGTPEPDTKWDNCTYAADEYLYRDSLHPTAPIHELLAKSIAEALA